jgi:hypothetical protein
MAEGVAPSVLHLLEWRGGAPSVTAFLGGAPPSLSVMVRAYVISLCVARPPSIAFQEGPCSFHLLDWHGKGLPRFDMKPG